jgi:uncharacterized protein (TIGR02246 family)
MIYRTQNTEGIDMKSIFFMILFLITGCFLAGCAPQGKDPQQMITAAKALDQQFLEAFNKGDAEAVAALYWNSPEVVSYPPDMLEAVGSEAIKEAMAHSFANGPTGTLEVINPQYMVAGDYVVSWGKALFKTTMPDGMPVEMTLRYTDVKTERDGKWVYTHDHASVPMPAPEGM